MNQIPFLDARTILKHYGLTASKSLGQNFLQDRDVLESIAVSAEIDRTDSVLEIGPGLGSLTRYLAVAAKQVIAVELDAKLIPILESVLHPYPNVRIVRGDILKLAPADFIDPSRYIVVANIPYYITSAVIRHLLEGEVRPRRMVLTIQEEVAQRICAVPGDMSLLALSVQVYGTPRITARVQASAFFPVPNVDSAVICVDIHPEPRIPHPHLDTFFRLIKAGFSQKRKTLRNSLSAGLHIQPAEAAVLLSRAGIDPQRRAETLSIEEWGNLANLI